MGFNILIVDDSSITRKVIKKVLAMTGLELDSVHEAENGIEALKVLEDQWIDLIFADLNMPEMGGVELVQRLAKDDRLESTPVIIITSNRNQERLAELKKMGVRACLNKPFRPEDLRDVIASAISVELGG